MSHINISIFHNEHTTYTTLQNRHIVKRRVGFYFNTDVRERKQIMTAITPMSRWRPNCSVNANLRPPEVLQTGFLKSGRTAEQHLSLGPEVAHWAPV